MTKKIADKGATEAWLRAHMDYSGDDCLPWPYGKNNHGYGLAVIDGKQLTASRWMCILVHGPAPTPKHHSAHSCGKGHLGCVHPRHVLWKTAKENAADRLIHGTSNLGERNGKTWLTEADVRAIREAPPHLKPLMDRYGLSLHGVAKIRGRKRWAHVPETKKGADGTATGPIEAGTNPPALQSNQPNSYQGNKKMKLLIVITAIAGTLGIVAPAAASQTCSWIGDFFVCNGSGGTHSSCSWIGDYWVCN